MSDKFWDPDEVLASAAQEREVRDLNHTQLATRLMEENLDFAIARVIHLVKYTHNEKLAFDASRYLIERVMGRVPDFGDVSSRDDLLELVHAISDSERILDSDSDS